MPQNSLEHLEDALPSGIVPRASATIDLSPCTVKERNYFEYEYCYITRSRHSDKGQAPKSKVEIIASEISLRLEQVQPRTGAQQVSKPEFMLERNDLQTEKENLLEQIQSLREKEERQSLELGKIARLLYLSELGRKTAVDETRKLERDLRTVKDAQCALLKEVNALELGKASLKEDLRNGASSSASISELKAHIENLKCEIVALRSSTSWRITAPARALTGRLRRLLKSA